jgi:prepilin-type N-terminal cleavage/methylation domain-containing protein
MTKKVTSQPCDSGRGFTVLELVIVLAVGAVLAAIAVPQIMSQRRLTRSVAITREIMTNIRYARQLALTQAGATPTGALNRVAYTFQYDDTTKQLKIIGPIQAGATGLNDAGYPNNTGSAVVAKVNLTQGGLSTAEISTGIPSGLPGAPTTVDTITGASLAGGRLNITFQPDGTVVDANGTPIDQGLFIYNSYNSAVSQGTASAITVRGASGRAKIWRYTVNANANASTYSE